MADMSTLWMFLVLLAISGLLAAVWMYGQRGGK